MIQNKVSIIGLGYVGFPLAISISKNENYQVFGFDINKSLIDKLKKTHKNLKITFSNQKNIIKNSEFIIICVPTPIKSNFRPDLRPIKQATKSVSKYLEKGQKIIIESTVNPGVCEEIILPILEKNGLKGGRDFELSHCPERINPGDKKWDVENIPRNIGSLTKKGNKLVANFYRSFLKAEINEVSSLKIAEATKIIENTFRDINIAYVNELAKSFDLMNINLLEVIHAASNKPFAFMPHFPGCGVGGHCIPVDPYYLIDRAKKAGFNHSFLKIARKINNSMPTYMIDLLKQNLKKIKQNIQNTKIGVLGLSYKADIGDLRESPSLKVIEILEKNKPKKIHKFDPYFPKLSNVQSLNELLTKSEVILLTIDHNIFKNIQAEKLKKNQIKIVIDGKNCLNKEAIIKNDILYKGIGH